jgi:hypothetical protein
MNVYTLYPNPVSQYTNLVLSISDDLYWLSSDSFILDPIDNDIESQLSFGLTDLYT